jgi:hypothetical protein
MYAAAINRSSPTTRSPEDVRCFAADGVLARELGRSYQRGHDARHPWHACLGRLIPHAAQESACTLPERRPGLRPIKAQDGTKIRLETVVGGLPAPLTRPSAAEPASHACDA